MACIRNFSSTAYIIYHILRRIKFYKLKSSIINTFIKDANKQLDFLKESIFALFENFAKEAQNLKLVLPHPDSFIDDSEDEIVGNVLPQNINDEGVKEANEYLTRVAKEFINTCKVSEPILCRKKIPLKDLDESLIPEKINEETLRRIETQVHNAQSIYDTYIQKTPFEAKNKIAGIFRGYISITRHLLAIARELCHFYERHGTSVRNEITRQKMSRIIRRDKILSNIMNFALFYYSSFILEGTELAEEILSTFSSSESVTVKAPKGLGFHLRPSTLVAKIVNHYDAKVSMIVNEKEFDAASVIDIMWAGGMIKKNNIIEVSFKGDPIAIKDLISLAEANYGEDTMGNATDLPEDISYLRKS